MEKQKYKHMGNVYFYDSNFDVYYQSDEDLKHFVKVAKNYPYYNILHQQLRIFLDKNNPMHTSFFDEESMSIHLLSRHLERYTIIHELNHCLQFICGIWDEDDFVDKKYWITKPIVATLDKEFQNNVSSKNFDDREPSIAYCDIINSFAFGRYAVQMGSKTHIPSYYRECPTSYMLESHSNYQALKFNNRLDILKHIPQQIVDYIESYDRDIQKKCKELV